ncbi:MAG: YceI family protein [Micromonosporaceae bacterium]
MTQADGPGQAGEDVTALARDGGLAGRWTLDPQASSVEFRVKHFWNAVTVRGWFERLEGEGTVQPDGTVTGQLVIDATSLNTKNKQRDRHLRSADFFGVEQHPRVVVAVRRAALTGGGQLAAEGTLEAAGIGEPVSFTANVVHASPDSVTLRAELTVDRSRFGMTWRPMGIASIQALGSVTARFVRERTGT